jgi:gluconolactonase
MKSLISTDPLLPIDRFEIFANGLDHPECLAFDRDGDLWAGGEGGQVYRISPAGAVEQITTLGSFNGGIAFSPAGELFVCNPARGIVRVKRDGSFETFATHAGNRQLICPNYGVFDAAGNYYLTDSGQWKKNTGCLCRFTPDGRGTVIAGPFGYANGLALSAGEQRLYMVESDADRVYRFHLREDGTIGGSEVYAREIGRLPDGLALDAQGNLYASCYASDDIWRIGPNEDKIRLAWDRWAILLSRPTNMAFGGEDFDVLYVANLGRTTITRVKLDVRGQRLVNLV